MMFWLIAAPSGVALFAVIWWSSGRAKPDLRRRSMQAEIGIREGSPGMYDSGGGGGPDAGAGGS